MVIKKRATHLHVALDSFELVSDSPHILYVFYLGSGQLGAQSLDVCFHNIIHVKGGVITPNIIV